MHKCKRIIKKQWNTERNNKKIKHPTTPSKHAARNEEKDVKKKTRGKLLTESDNTENAIVCSRSHIYNTVEYVDASEANGGGYVCGYRL